MKNPYGNMMKQMRKAQEEMAKIDEELAGEETQASAGGGAVTVRVNGKQEVLAVKIKPEAADPDDIEMLEDLILAATNEALSQSREMAASKMGRLTGGLNIPGLT